MPTKKNKQNSSTNLIGVSPKAVELFTDKYNVTNTSKKNNKKNNKTNTNKSKSYNEVSDERLMFRKGNVPFSTDRIIPMGNPVKSDNIGRSPNIPVEPIKINDLEESDIRDQSFIRNWMNHRTDVLKNNLKSSNFFPTDKLAEKVKNEQLSNMQSARHFNFNNKEDLERWKTTFGEKMAEVHSRGKNKYTADDMVTYMNYTQDGSYNPYTHTIVSNPGKKAPFYLHERTHAMRPIPQETKISKILSKATKLNESSNSDYYNNPKEVYARLMEFRRDNKLDPTKKYSTKFIQEMKDIKKYNDIKFSIDKNLGVFNDTPDKYLRVKPLNKYDDSISDVIDEDPYIMDKITGSRNMYSKGLRYGMNVEEFLKSQGYKVNPEYIKYKNDKTQYRDSTLKDNEDWQFYRKNNRLENKKVKDHEILNSYDNETIEQLLNEVADNGIKQSNNNIAAYGGNFNNNNMKRPQRFLGAAIGIAQLGMGIYGMINKANAEKKAIEENNRNIDNINAENIKNRLQTDSLNMKNFESNSTSFYGKGGIKTKYNKGGVKFKTDEVQKLNELEVVANRPVKSVALDEINVTANRIPKTTSDTTKTYIPKSTVTYIKDGKQITADGDLKTVFSDEWKSLEGMPSDGHRTEFLKQKYSAVVRSTGFQLVRPASTDSVPSKFANGGNAGVTREASDMSIAYGARHEEYNPQQGGSGVPYGDIEVEGGGAKGNQAGEVIKHEGQQDFIFSDRIPFDNKNTFAQVAQAITKSKANLENLIRLASKEVNDEKAKINFAKNIPEKSTIERNISKKMFKVNQIKSEIAKINDEIEQLKQAQLEKGTAMGLYDEKGQPVSEDVNEAQEFSVGGFLNSTGFTAGMGIAQTGLNLASNIISANRMKKLKTPSYTPVVAGQTGRVNMSADRNNVAQGMSSMSDSIDSSISNPQVALAYKNKIKSEGISQLSKINQDEARTNVGIEDTNISRNLQVDAMNNEGQMQAASMKLQKDMTDINNNQNIIRGLSSDINQIYGNIKSSENEKQVMNLRKSMAEDDVRRRYNLIELGIDPLQLNNMDENSKIEFLLGKGVKEEDLYKYIKYNNSTTPLPKGEIVPEGWIGKYGGKVRKYANGGYVYANGGIAGVNQELLNSRIADIPNVKDSNIGFGNTSMTPYYQPIDNVKDKFDNFDIPKLVQTYAVKMEEGKVNPVLDEFQKILEEHGIKTKRTSGYRNSKTSSGKVSKHAVGHAIDIVPDGISFDDMYKIIYNSPKIREFATKNKIGILNEADDRVLRKTKGTGKHAHVSIGENIAMDFWNPEMSNNGIYTENFYKKHNISYE